MTDRPHISYTSAELRALVKRNPADVTLMHAVYAELVFRSRRPARELREEIAKELQQIHKYFVWPSTAAPKGEAELDDSCFTNDRGILGYIGYRVGTTGLSMNRRRELLDYAYEGHIPLLNSPSYMREWGEPNTSVRLQKIAESIAAFARNAKRRSASRFASAIEEWEFDLAYLKRTYYDRRFSFPWPLTAT